MKLRRLHLFLFLAIVGISCNHKSYSNLEVSKSTFFDPNNLGKLNKGKSLTITSIISECGEWGGHEEQIIVSSDEESSFHARHIVYSYNCDTAYKLGYDPHVKIIRDTNILLNTEKQHAIKNYIYQLTETKIAEKRAPYSCNFSITNSDSTMVIKTKVCRPSFEYYRILLINLALKQ